MRLLGFLAFLGCLGLPAYAQDGAALACNPACANQPAACCNVPASDTFLAEQCTGATSNLVHFVITNGTAWIDLRAPATFDVSGLSGTTTLGDVMPITFGFTIGKSTASARFQVVDDSLPITPVGQCVGTAGDTYTGLPSLVSASGRALQVSGRNPLFCRATGFPDLLCFQVKGQVGPPFQAQQLCSPDRVEYACGEVH